MCTFINDELTFNDVNIEKTTNYGVYLKPTPEKEYYRFRLLWFTDKTDRKTPFFTRLIHECWENKEEGPNINHTIICPTSPHVKEHWSGDAFKDCPICRFTNSNFIVWKDSGYKDKTASQNYRVFKKKFQAIIPVYVVSDPHYEPNNGKMKVFIIDNSEVFDKFKKLVIERNSNTKIFNSENAVDFLVRADNVEKVYNEGTEKEFRYTRKEIVQMGFSNKPYTISAITKDAVDDFPFGEIYYATPTINELRNFYKSHCLQTIEDECDLELADISVSSSSKKEDDREVIKKDEIPSLDTDDQEDLDIEGIDDNEIETIVEDSSIETSNIETLLDDTPNNEDFSEESSSDDIDVDALLDDIGI